MINSFCHQSLVMTPRKAPEKKFPERFFFNQQDLSWLNDPSVQLTFHSVHVRDKFPCEGDFSSSGYQNKIIDDVLFVSGDLLFESCRSEEKNALLLQLVLDCLHKIFLYDTQRFLSKERADTLMGPLLDQVSRWNHHLIKTLYNTWWWWWWWWW